MGTNPRSANFYRPVLKYFAPGGLNHGRIAMQTSGTRFAVSGIRNPAMTGICLLVWCLGQGAAAAERLTFANDMRDPSRTERILAYELGALLGGVVTQETAGDAVFGGLLPVQFNFKRGRFVIEGGAIVPLRIGGSCTGPWRTS